MEKGSGYGWAIAAGACAAMAAFIAKSTSAHSHSLGGWRLEAVGYGGVVLMNVAMWSCYVNSLKSETSSLTALQATVINFSTNFLVCGLAGFFFFNESLHFQWFAGAFLIVLGTFILTKSSIGPEPASHDAKSSMD